MAELLLRSGIEPLQGGEENGGSVMFKRIVMGTALAGAIFGQAMQAQQQPPPTTSVNPNQHPDLATAQSDIVDAYQRIELSQRTNSGQLGGHAAKARDLLSEASAELQAAADFADANQPPSPPPPPPDQSVNASGKWTIYANDINDPGGSTKFVQIQQMGSQLSGKFKGPNQSGNISGFVNGNHIEFSTHTRDVLTFRGEVQGNTMSGQYGIHGQHAAWNAVRSD